MAHVKSNGSTLHYTIGSAIAGPVSVGDVVEDFRGDKLTVLSGTAPHHPGSTGRVYVQAEPGWKAEFYPGVIGARWVPDTEACAMNLTHISRIAFGRGKPHGGAVQEYEWEAFESLQVSPRFPGGFTIIHAAGGWRDAITGQTIEEATTVLEVAHDGGEESLRAIRALAGAYKILFNQDAVMVSTVPASVEFI